MKTFDQIERDYQTFMNGYQQSQSSVEQMNPHVFFEEFSIYDKNLQSTSATSVIC